MQPNRYTELFFLDEATALAAGHRPCAQCRWADFNRFIGAWLAGNPDAGIERARCTDPIDRVLHRERVTPRHEKVTYAAQLGDLPDGVLVAPERLDNARLLWQGRLHSWTPAGYADVQASEPGREVYVLTPRSIVNTIAAGSLPVIHPSLAAG
jgi:methylphosphotriester-DNA--protein-cysteine methyltransferase